MRLLEILGGRLTVNPSATVLRLKMEIAQTLMRFLTIVIFKFCIWIYVQSPNLRRIKLRWWNYKLMMKYHKLVAVITSPNIAIFWLRMDQLWEDQLHVIVVSNTDTTILIWFRQSFNHTSLVIYSFLHQMSVCATKHHCSVCSAHRSYFFSSSFICKHWLVWQVIYINWVTWL